MSNHNQSSQLSIDDVRKKNEEYEATLMAIQAISQIISEFHHNQDEHIVIHSSIGRRMDTTRNNRIKCSIEITPDIVIQAGDSWGLIIEAKRSIPMNHDNRWKDTVSQLEKYDDDLIGWWTNNETIKGVNISLLIDTERSVDFSHYLESLINDNQIQKFTHSFSIIEFSREQKVKQFLRIRKIWGDINPVSLQSTLTSGKSISVEGLIAKKGFYDHEPDAVEYTMALLWQNVFTERKQGAKYDEKQKAWLLEINLDELTVDLQKLYGQKSDEPRQQTFPRRQWIKKALEAFVILDYAISINQNLYIVKFKKFSNCDLFERFFKHRNIKKNKTSNADAQQLVLFPNKDQLPE